MNETIKVMKSRRSCRNFKPDMVSKDVLDLILEAGTYAPTGMGKQSPIIIAVTDKTHRDELSEFGKDILRRLGIEGEYEGIGHCALGYAAEPPRDAAARKEDYIYRI